MGLFGALGFWERSRSGLKFWGGSGVKCVCVFIYIYIYVYIYAYGLRALGVYGFRFLV